VRASGKRAPLIITQPIAWWTKAEREKSQPFCSWMSEATPETKNASAIVKCQ
jgi:hypothetical protein